jgi:RNA methyltransferase, TrmH family
VAQGAERLLGRPACPPETEILLMPRELLDSALATETPQPIAALVEPPDGPGRTCSAAMPKENR